MRARAVPFAPAWLRGASFPYRLLAAGLLVALWACWMARDGLSSPVRGALAGGGGAALATAIGTLPVLLSRRLAQRMCDCLLGFGAGIMLAATAFSLVVPAIAAARANGAGPVAASAIAAGGIAAGTALVMLLERLAHHIEWRAPAGAASTSAIRGAWLFVSVITIHNMPEGLAIGVAYGGASMPQAHGLALGIAIQDIPEGMVVALALRAIGYGRRFSAVMGAASGLIEPIAAVAGAALIAVSSALLPWGLAAAAGAMLFVVAHDVVPQAHAGGNGRPATLALVAGFIVMMVLDTALA